MGSLAPTPARRRRTIFDDAALLAHADAANERGDAGRLHTIVEYVLAVLGDERGEDVDPRGPDTPLQYSRASWCQRLRVIHGLETRTRRHVAELERAGLLA